MPRLAETAPAGDAWRRVHGGLLEDEVRSLGLDPATLVDFSVNCNPYGPCTEVAEAIRTAPIDRYPDPTARPARAAIASMLGVDPSQVALGNGAAELLWTLARVLVRPGTPVLVVEPTFCEFRAAAQHSGASISEWRAQAGDGFSIDLGALERLVREAPGAVVYLCSPNTPTGVSVPAVDVARLAQANPRVTVVLDQSFLALSDRAEDAQVRMPGNVVCVRSMTKEHAIPGVRLGYLVAPPTLVARVEEARPAWTTGAVAQAAAIAASRATRFVEGSRRKVLDDRERLAEMFRRLGFAPVPTTTCFLLVRVGEARPLRARLFEQHGVLVRDCTSFELPEWIRVAARPEKDRERLEAALREELRGC
jgi:histidinol-phosphate/aromatic aminotransferase/cobyric acid decarboxylase-like protein